MAEIMEATIHDLLSKCVNEAVATALLAKMKEEWAEQGRRPDHECRFTEFDSCCNRCGIERSEWLKLE